MNLVTLTATAAFVADLVVGAVALWQNPRQRANQLFAGIGVAIACWTLSFIGLSQVHRPADAMLWAHLLYTGLTLLPPLFCHFSLVLVRATSVRARMAVVLGYVLSAAVLVLNFTGRVSGGVHYHHRYDFYFPTPGPAYPFFVVTFYLISGVGAAVIFKRRATTDIGLERARLKYPIAGVWVALVGGIFNTLLVAGKSVFPFSFLSILAAACLMGYGIFRYRFLDTHIVLRKGAVYALLTGALSAVYVTVVFSLLIAFHQREAAIPAIVVAALVSAIAFQFLRNRIQALVDRVFFKSSYDYQEVLRSFGDRLTSVIELDELEEEITSRILESMKLTHCGLWVKEGDRAGYRLRRRASWVRKVGQSQPEAVLEESDPLVRYLAAQRQLAVHDEILLRPSVNDEDKQVVASLERQDAQMVVPVLAREELIAFLSLGAKLSGDMFSIADIDLLTGLANQAAIALENAQLVQVLKELKEYSDLIIETVPLGLMTVNAENRVERVNGVMAQILRNDPGALVGCDSVATVPAEMKPWVQTAMQRALVKGEIAEEYDLRLESSNSHEARTLHLKAAPLRGNGGAVTGAVLVAEDVTERRQLERRLIQADRLVSVGTLAAGVAHEINNPLAAILGFAQILLDTRPAGSQDWQDLKVIEETALRCKDIVQNLLEFSRRYAPHRQPVDIPRTIERTLSLTAYAAKSRNVEIVTSYEEELPLLYADESRLRQVFMNLIVNAVQAMADEGGGTLIIRAYLSNGHLVTEFADTGPGVPRELQERIFEPFFTTKNAGEGTGLGLAITRDIVEDHGGKLILESKEGQGATFRLHLPVNEAS